MNVCRRAHHCPPLSGDSITSHICQLINTASGGTRLAHAGQGQGRRAPCVFLHTNSTLLFSRPDSETRPSENTGEPRLRASLAKQNWKRDQGLFKGLLKNAVQMLNFVVFHLFPVLGVPAHDARGTSGEPGKSWDFELARLPGSGPLPWTLMSDSRYEMLPLRAECVTTDWINIHLSALFLCCFIGDCIGWVVPDYQWYDIVMLRREGKHVWD